MEKPGFSSLISAECFRAVVRFWPSFLRLSNVTAYITGLSFGLNKPAEIIFIFSVWIETNLTFTRCNKVEYYCAIARVCSRLWPALTGWDLRFFPICGHLPIHVRSRSGHVAAEVKSCRWRPSARISWTRGQTLLSSSFGLWALSEDSRSVRSHPNSSQNLRCVSPERHISPRIPLVYCLKAFPLICLVQLSKSPVCCFPGLSWNDLKIVVTSVARSPVM